MSEGNDEGVARRGWCYDNLKVLLRMILSHIKDCMGEAISALLLAHTHQPSLLSIESLYTSI